MNMNAKKYGITKLLSGLRRKFVLQISALEDKHTANLWNFCVTKGEDFGDQNYNELLDILCLDPADRYKKATSSAFLGMAVNTIADCVKVLEDECVFLVDGSPRVNYIRFYEATLEKALGLIDQHQNTAMETIRDRFAGQQD
jgi:hypothetical protein